MSSCVCISTARQQQCFLAFGCHGYEPVKQRNVSQLPVMKDYIPSLVIRLPEEKKVLKLIRARKWVEYAKLLWNRSRASKEIYGNRLLQQAGVAVPQISEYGFGVFPGKSNEFLGYYVMQDLEAAGYENSRFLFLENRITAECRENFIFNVIRDVDRMQKHCLVFSDLKFENIFCNDRGDTVWIDTGVSRFSGFRKNKFPRKHNDAIDYFVLHHRKFLSVHEIEQFEALYL